MDHNVLALCAGAGGLELGLRRVLPASRVVAYVEREAYACAVLAARMGENKLAAAPIWTDVCTFDGAPWRGVVDIVAGGFPCQDISNAGKRAGIHGERSGLWKEFVRVIGEVEPELVILENVAALRTNGLETVLQDLAGLGFDAEWGTLRASDVGAPHQRNRIFIVAHHDGRRREADPGRGLPYLERPAHGGYADGCHAELGHPDGARREGRSVRDGERADKRAAWPPSSQVGWPPGPGDAAGWAEWDGPQPGVYRGTHGLADRVDRLRLCGNGVVPQQAAEAIRQLLGRLELAAADPILEQGELL